MKLSRKKIEEYTEKYGEPIGYKEGVPILQAIPRDDFPFGWKVFCVYCEKFHLHGRMRHKMEHRVAHCGSDSPYILAGYWIQQVEGDE